MGFTIYRLLFLFIPGRLVYTKCIELQSVHGVLNMVQRQLFLLLLLAQMKDNTLRTT